MKTKQHTIVPTSNFKRIKKRLLHTMDSHGFSLICGQNGYGKTGALKDISKDDPEIEYFRIGVGETGREFYARFLAAISRNKNFNPQSLRNSQIHLLLERATYYINTRKDIKLVIIDEFGNHDSRFIPYLRQIWDNIEENAGLLLAGPPSALNELNAWRKAGRKGINEIFSRLGNRIEKLKVHTRNDIKLICGSRGIHEEFETNFFYRNSPDLRMLHMLIDDYKSGLLKIP